MIDVNRYIQQTAPGKFRVRPELKTRIPAWISAPKSDIVYPFVATTTSRTINFVQPNYSDNSPSVVIANQLVFADSSDTTAANACTIKMADVQYQRDLMAYPLHMRAVFGTAQLPGVMHEPIIINANSVIRGEITKISGGNVNLYPYLAGAEFFDGNMANIDTIMERKKYVAPFWMMPDNVTSIVLTAGQTLNTLVSQNGRGHFLAMSLVAISTGNFSLSITENRTRRKLMNGLVTRNNGIGDARYPYKFEAPFLIENGVDLQWNVTDLSNSGNTIYLAMQGKMFTGCKISEIPKIERDLMIPYDTLRV